MKSVRQVLTNIFILVVLIIFTFLIIFHNFDFNKIMEIISNANTTYILLAILFMSFYYIFEGISIKNILNKLGEKVSLFRTIKYTYIGFFFGGITPAASGGQPMEIYYMNRDGVQVNHGAIAMLVHLICYQIVIISLGIIGYIFHSELFEEGFSWIFFVGITINLVALTVMCIGLFYPKFSKKLVSLIIKIMEKLKVNNIEEKKEKMNSSIKEYNESAKFLKKNPKILLISFLMALFQMVSYYTVTYFIYKSFDLNTYNLIGIVTIESMLFVSVSSIPLPGSVGVSESTFLKIFTSVFGEEILPSAMLLNRVCNFYLYIVICSLVVLFNIIMLKVKENRIIESKE